MDSAKEAPPPPNGHPRRSSPAPTWLSLDALEAFPDRLFRLPVPNALFDRRPELSEAAFRTGLAFCHLAYRFVPACTGETSSAANGDSAANENALAEDAAPTSHVAPSGHWTCPERWMERSALETATGLSDTATRAALKELGAIGWVEVDRDSKAYRYRWLQDVPTRRFTQVPTVLLAKLPALPFGTAFDVFWAILRGTWGWTAPTPSAVQTATGSEAASGSAERPIGPRMHRRWVQRSAKGLATTVGRCVKSVKTAIKRLDGQWIERVRPSCGAAQFRVLPEALLQLDEAGPAPGAAPDTATPTSSPQARVSGDIANDFPPRRQRNTLPLKEPPSRKKNNKQARGNAAQGVSPRAASPQAPATAAVPANSNSQGKSRPTGTGRQIRERVPETKRGAYDWLVAEGMWPGRAGRVCQRYSLERLRRNSSYYTHQTQLQPIQNAGAWLYSAITEDFAFDKTPNGSEEADLPALALKARYTADEMHALIAAGTPPEHFHRAAGEPERPWMYLGEAGPGRRTKAA